MTGLPTPAYAAGGITIYQGDCVEVMAAMPPASIDAIVTDPPYGLQFMDARWDRLWRSRTEADQEWMAERVARDADDGLAVRQRKLPDLATSRRRGREMQAWHERWAAEALRVIKPGGHLVAFGGARTYHRLASALEDAGWELRDCLSWLYGSGFPKSHDVARAIDRRRRDDIEHVRAYLKTARDARGMTNRQVAEHFGFVASMAGHWIDHKSQPLLPTMEQWAMLTELLGLDGTMDAEVQRLNARKGQPGEAWAEAEIIGEHTTPAPGLVGHRFKTRDALQRAPQSDLARAWDGWGTALKPAWEPIILARRPPAGSVADNIEAHGVGALNIDACRIGADTAGDQDRAGAAGRWPANVAMDTEAAAQLDQMAPGAPSRFFYTGKAAPSERAAGITGQGRQRDPSRHADQPSMNGGEGNPYNRGAAPAANHHPTVKPLDLMQWLITLIVPPGGVVLDPFLGSGTTAAASAALYRPCIGIELDPDYVAIAAERCLHWSGPLFAMEAKA